MLDAQFDGFQVELNLSVPLRNRKAKSERAIADLELTRAQATLDEERQSIRAEVRAAVWEAQTAKSLIALASDSVSLSVDTLTAERARFESGLSTSYQVLQLQEVVAAARSRRAAAEAAYRRKLADYHSSVGLLMNVHGIQLAVPTKDAVEANTAAPALDRIKRRPRTSPKVLFAEPSKLGYRAPDPTRNLEAQQDALDEFDRSAEEQEAATEIALARQNSVAGDSAARDSSTMPISERYREASPAAPIEKEDLDPVTERLDTANAEVEVALQEDVASLENESRLVQEAAERAAAMRRVSDRAEPCLRLRAAATSESRVLRCVPAGDEVSLSGRAEGDWTEVTTDTGEVGWMFASLLEP